MSFIRRATFLLSLIIFGLSPLSTAFAEAVAIGDLSLPQVLQVTEKFISSGKPEDAVALAKVWHPESPSHKSIQAFVQARILQKQGNIAGAVQGYRAILAAEPKFRPARVALAHALTLVGDDEAAKFQLENLLSENADSGNDNELKRMLAGINARKPLKYGFYASLLPSSNINTATDSKTVYLNGIPFTINETRKSGIGILGGAWVTYRQAFTPTITFIASANIDNRFYPAPNTHITNLSAAAGIAHEQNNMRASAQFIGGAELGDFKTNSTYLGIRMDGAVKLPSNFTLKPFLEVKNQKFDFVPTKNGWLYTGRLTLDKTVSASRFYRGFVGAEFNRAHAARFSYNEALVGVGGYNEFSAGISIYGEMSVATRKYRGIGPGLTSERSDTRLQVRGIFTKRDLNIFGLAPQLGYTFTRNISSSVFDDYTKHDFDVRLTKAF